MEAIYQQTGKIIDLRSGQKLSLGIVIHSSIKASERIQSWSMDNAYISEGQQTQEHISIG